MWHADRFTGRLFTGGGDDWRQRAACRDHDPELFFPLPGEDTEPAKAVCRRCEVRPQCAEVGMGEESGIWGGLDERQRRALRRQDSPPPPPREPAPPGRYDGRRDRSPWMPDEDRRLRELHEQRWDAVTIAAVLGRTPGAIRSRRKHLGLPYLTPPQLPAGHPDISHHPLPGRAQTQEVPA